MTETDLQRERETETETESGKEGKTEGGRGKERFREYSKFSVS